MLGHTVNWHRRLLSQQFLLKRKAVLLAHVLLAHVLSESKEVLRLKALKYSLMLLGALAFHWSQPRGCTSVKQSLYNLQTWLGFAVQGEQQCYRPLATSGGHPGLSLQTSSLGAPSAAQGGNDGCVRQLWNEETPQNRARKGNKAPFEVQFPTENLGKRKQDSVSLRWGRGQSL